ncbi:hypothetical protein J2X69_000618 [Algoriphagus sp. 4150]|uniref:hypothetical protein n=1 Tax=Algoriphagus sp. 4150 TaxID=2817756 RepID=UPI002866735E|nr:hypothetical protein [Algoriphagus sp. 4150]MDR7128290.1 hypothetical protein [Algoriphagus sp. 4150]
MFAKNAVAFVFLLFLITKTVIVLGQDKAVFADSISFAGFLINQGEISGLEFRLTDSSGRIFLDSSLNVLSEIGQTADFKTALLLKDSLLRSDSSVWEIQFLVYEQEHAFSAVREYVSNLLRNGDIEVTTPDTNVKDYISLASKERYTPLFPGTSVYGGDYKMVIVILTISLFVLFALGMIIFMLIYKTRRNRKEKLQTLYDELIIAPLSEILFEKTLDELESLSDEELYSNFPAKQLKKSLYTQVLVGRILALNKKMKGDFKLKLKALYRRLKLEKASIEKLKSSKWDTVVMGLVEINEMDLKEGLKEVKKLVNSPNFQIRSQAVATVLNLSDDVDLSFLRDQAYPLSRWQQMNYLRIIKHLNSSRDLHINSLFSSKNQSIRMFGYKLVRILGLVDLLAELEEKFQSSADPEKIEIIKTFEYLGVPSEMQLVNAGLKSANLELVAIAAKAAGTIGDDSTAIIIGEILENAPDFGLKLILLRSLLNLNGDLYRQFITDNPTSDSQRINNHLLDPLLKDV